MNAFIAGVLCFVYLVFANAVAAGAQTFTLTLVEPPDCDVSPGNATVECDNDGSGATFITTFRQVTIEGLTGAPSEVNAIWLFINGLAFVTGLVLIIAYFIGLPIGGSG